MDINLTTDLDGIEICTRIKFIRRAPDNFVLLENGTPLLLEDGSNLLLE